MMETYHGYVRSPADAIKLFEACRQGLLPRIQRRLSEKERQAIRSGSVFVWDEREAGMRRWTDGKSWSASRVSGSFLTYREMEGKRGSGFPVGRRRRFAGKTPDSSHGSDEDADNAEPEGYRYKPDGLMKQSFSITTSLGQHLHLINYYSRAQVGTPDLPQPMQDPALRHIIPAKGLYPESTWNDSHQSPPQAARDPNPNHQYLQPHPPQNYAPQYAHHQGAPWPPSPVATPPYSSGHYTTAPYPPQSHHQQSQSQSQSQPQPQPQPQPPYPTSQGHYQQSSYDRPAPTLPPVQRTLYQPHPQQYPPQPPHHAAHAPTSDSRIAPVGSRGPYGAPPALGPSIKPVGGLHSTTPPNRAISVSPPRSSHSDSNTSHKASLSALLHPTPASSEPTSANPGSNSAGSSPRSMPQPQRPVGMSEDARALSVLDRKFCV